MFVCHFRLHSLVSHIFFALFLICFFLLFHFSVSFVRYFSICFVYVCFQTFSCTPPIWSIDISIRNSIRLVALTHLSNLSCLIALWFGLGHILVVVDDAENAHFAPLSERKFNQHQNGNSFLLRKTTVDHTFDVTRKRLIYYLFSILNGKQRSIG